MKVSVIPFFHDGLCNIFVGVLFVKNELTGRVQRALTSAVNPNVKQGASNSHGKNQSLTEEHPLQWILHFTEMCKSMNYLGLPKLLMSSRSNMGHRLSSGKLP